MGYRFNHYCAASIGDSDLTDIYLNENLQDHIFNTSNRDQKDKLALCCLFSNIQHKPFSCYMVCNQESMLHTVYVSRRLSLQGALTSWIRMSTYTRMGWYSGSATSHSDLCARTQQEDTHPIMIWLIFHNCLLRAVKALMFRYKQRTRGFYLAIRSRGYEQTRWQTSWYTCI